MNLIYFSLAIIFNFYFHIQPVDCAAAKVKAKPPDVMVSGECATFDITKKFCKDEAELKYGDTNKNGRNQCCVLLVEIDCLRPFEKVCIQHRFLDDAVKTTIRDKVEFKNLQCGGFQYDCPEESYNIWMMIISIFTASIAIASFCIICVIYIKS